MTKHKNATQTKAKIGSKSILAFHCIAVSANTTRSGAWHRIVNRPLHVHVCIDHMTPQPLYLYCRHTEFEHAQQGVKLSRLVTICDKYEHWDD